MKLEILDGIGKPLQLNATRLVAYGDKGTPIAAIFQDGDGAYHVLRPNDPKFQQTLRAWGVHRTVIVHTQDVIPPDSFSFRV